MAEPRVELKLYLTDTNSEDPHYRAKWSVSSGSARYDLRNHERLLYEMVGEWAKTQMALYDERSGQPHGMVTLTSEERTGEGERHDELELAYYHGALTMWQKCQRQVDNKHIHDPNPVADINVAYDRAITDALAALDEVHPNRSRTRPEPVSLAERVCHVLEMLALYELDGEKKLKGLLQLACRVYKYAHYANTPDCQKNHPEWLSDFELLEEQINRSCAAPAAREKNDERDAGTTDAVEPTVPGA